MKNIIKNRDKYGENRFGINKNCLYCKTLFFSRVDQERKYCSHKCSSDSRRKRIKVNCNVCNVEFELLPKRYKNSKRKKFFCNKECKQQAHRKGGSIAPKHYGTSNRFNYRALFKKCDWLCARCKYKEFKCGIDIHHVNGDRNDNRKENLIPLCSPCHRALHKKLWNLEAIRLDEGHDWKSCAGQTVGGSSPSASA